jgi:hypothetical protein
MSLGLMNHAKRMKERVLRTVVAGTFASFVAVGTIGMGEHSNFDFQLDPASNAMAKTTKLVCFDLPIATMFRSSQSGKLLLDFLALMASVAWL